MKQNVIPIGYYLDNNIYKKCYYTCKECELGGDNITHNCSICNDNYTSILINNSYYNCYIDIEQTEINTDTISLSQITTKIYIDDNCTEEKPFKNLLTKECIDFCDINDLFQKICILNYTEYEYPEDKIFGIINYGKSNINLSIIENIPNLEFEVSKVTFKLINTKLSKEIINGIEGLDECKKLLSNHYSIPVDDTIFLLMINIFNKDENKNINKTLYYFYYPLNKEYLSQLNSTICENCFKNDISTNCSEYSMESILKNACTKCNEGYYPI